MKLLILKRISPDGKGHLVANAIMGILDDVSLA